MSDSAPIDALDRGLSPAAAGLDGDDGDYSFATRNASDDENDPYAYRTSRRGPTEGANAGDAADGGDASADATLDFGASSYATRTRAPYSANGRGGRAEGGFASTAAVVGGSADYYHLVVRRGEIEAQLARLDQRQRDRELEQGRIGMFYQRKLETRLRSLERERADMKAHSEKLLQNIAHRMDDWRVTDTIPSQPEEQLTQSKTHYHKLVQKLGQEWLSGQARRTAECIEDYDHAMMQLKNRRRVEEHLEKRRKEIDEALLAKKIDYMKAVDKDRRAAQSREQARVEQVQEAEERLLRAAPKPSRRSTAALMSMPYEDENNNDGNNDDDGGGGGGRRRAHTSGSRLRVDTGSSAGGLSPRSGRSASRHSPSVSSASGSGRVSPAQDWLEMERNRQRVRSQSRSPSPSPAAAGMTIVDVGRTRSTDTSTRRGDQYTPQETKRVFQFDERERGDASAAPLPSYELPQSRGSAPQRGGDRDNDGDDDNDDYAMPKRLPSAERARIKEKLDNADSPVRDIVGIVAGTTKKDLDTASRGRRSDGSRGSQATSPDARSPLSPLSPTSPFNEPKSPAVHRIVGVVAGTVDLDLHVAADNSGEHSLADPVSHHDPEPDEDDEHVLQHARPSDVSGASSRAPPSAGAGAVSSSSSLRTPGGGGGGGGGAGSSTRSSGNGKGKGITAKARTPQSIANRIGGRDFLDDVSDVDLTDDGAMQGGNSSLMVDPDDEDDDDEFAF